MIAVLTLFFIVVDDINVLVVVLVVDLPLDLVLGLVVVRLDRFPVPQGWLPEKVKHKFQKTPSSFIYNSKLNGNINFLATKDRGE